VASVRTALAEPLAADGAVVLDRQTWLDRSAAVQAEGVAIGLVAILGLAGVYAAIAVVNTLVMAVRERTGDLVLLRRAGATGRQALAMLAWEGMFVAAVGIGLGLLVTTVTLVTMPAALRTLSATAEVSVPVRPLGAVAVGCALLVVGTSAVAGAAALRRT